MSINKTSNVEDICSFLSTFKISEEIIQKFRAEKIKGNELFYFSDQDYDNFGLFVKKTRIKKRLEEIKNSTPNILYFNLNIYTNSSNAEILKFLKEEILLEENKLE